MKYSKKIGCFYPDEIQYKELPEDLVSVSDSDYSRIMSRPFGHTFSIDDGVVTVYPPKPSEFHEWNGSDWVIDSDGQKHLDEQIYQESIPKSVTMRQARRAMIDAKIYDKVDAAIKEIGGKSLVDWEYSNSFERSNPMLSELGKSLGLTEKQIDALFVAAKNELLPLYMSHFMWERASYLTD